MTHTPDAMRCLDANDVVRFLDGGATTADEDHIDACADCRALVTELGHALELAPTLADGSNRSTLGTRDRAHERSGAQLAETVRADDVAAWELASGAELVARGARIGRYIILDPLGAGAMGIVYRAYDPELDRDVALKLVRVLGDAARGERARERLVREAQSLARVKGHGVVKVYDASSAGEHVFIAMELVEGEDLAAWLARGLRSPRADEPRAAEGRTWETVVAKFIGAATGLCSAHAAGIIHRDFKPTNVLIGDVTGTHVSDFGLAIAAGDIDDDAVVGTPAYMSPEVKAGRPADARSDQYSFALSLCEALVALRRGEEVSLRGTVSERDLADVPDRVRPPLARALSTDPGARYPTMNELVTDLGTALAPRRAGVWLAGAAAVAIGAVVVAIIVGSGDGSRASCEAPADRFADAWDATTQQQIRTAFVASDHPLALDQFTRVKASLDRFAGDWTAAYVDACRATHVRHAQSADLLDRRMACLQTQRARLSAVTEQLAHADRALVARAIGAADIGDGLARCSDLAALRESAPLPATSIGRARAASATVRLAHAEAISLRGRYAPAIAEANAVLAEARAVGDLRLEADALRSAGESQWRAGDYAGALPVLHLAVDAAKRAGGADLEGGALLDVVAVLIEQGHYGEALQIARIAESTMRASHDEARLGKLAGNRGAIHYLQADYAAARVQYEEARATLERVYGPEDRRVGQAWMNLAALAAEGEETDPLPLYERALAIHRKALGPRHPEVALTLVNRSVALANAKRFDEAFRDLDTALALRIEVLGSKHPDVVGTIQTMGAVAEEKGDHAAALGYFREVLARNGAVLGADHPTLAHTQAGIGRQLVALARWAEAIAPLEAALVSFEKAGVRGSVPASSRFALARARWEAGGDRTRARADAAAALAAFDNAEQRAEVTAWIAAHRGVAR